MKRGIFLNTYWPNLMKTCSYPPFRNLYNVEPLVFLPTEETVKDLAFSPNINETLAAATDNIVLLYSSSDFELLRIFEKQNRDEGNFTSIAYGPSGTLIGGTNGGYITIWNIANGNIIHNVRVANTIIRSISSSQADGTIAIGTNNGYVFLLDPITGEIMKTAYPANRRMPIAQITFNFEGTILAAAGHGEIYVWSAPFFDNSPMVINNIRGDFGTLTKSMTFSREGVLALGSLDGLVNLWNPFTGNLINSFVSASTIQSLTYDHYGNLITSSIHNGTISILNPSSGTPLQTFRPGNSNTAVASNQYNGLLAVGLSEGGINIYTPTSRPGPKRALS